MVVSAGNGQWVVVGYWVSCSYGNGGGGGETWGVWVCVGSRRGWAWASAGEFAWKRGSTGVRRQASTVVESSNNKSRE